MTNTLKTILGNGQQQMLKSSESPRLDAEVLLGHVLNKGRAWLYANPEQILTPQQAEDFAGLIVARAKGKPIAHLTGQREFWSLLLQVNKHVLVPRPETELLVETALTYLPAESSATVLDLGTGSGAIAIALATERPNIRIVATDSSVAALRLAEKNAEAHCPGRIKFFKSDWFSAIPENKFELIVSNPPYIGAAELPLTDRELEYEPEQALYSDNNGLAAIEQIILGAPAHLHTNGWLLLEHGYAQADATSMLLSRAGFAGIRSYHDLANQPRVTQACYKDTA